MTVAKNNFENHIGHCSDAIHVYEYLNKSGYSADFGLRYVWVASVSALDHYISELVIEKSTEHFANSGILTAKMLNEGIPLESALKINAASPAQSLVEFRKAVIGMVRYRTFQKADDVADGLAFVWDQKHKWKFISAAMGMKNDIAKATLNAIAYRRDLIVHNADYNEATGALYECNARDAKNAIDHISRIVESIDGLIT